jgi:tRNA pseudouridine55 synthase
MTSHDAVGIVRRLTGMRRVGHTGTLDPMATGVLPICIGRATRIIEFMDVAGSPDAKSYRCEMKLGFVSDTQDTQGTLTQCAAVAELPDEDAIRGALKSLEGSQTQIPPVYSAIKYKGKPLYAYARAGEALPEDAIKKRSIYVNNITVNDMDRSSGTVSFDVDCSAGTYVRTICHDVGQKLGCGAVMSGLVRTKSGVFHMEDSYTPEQLEAMGDHLPILPMDSALTALPMIVLSGKDARAFQNGIRVEPDADQEGDFARVYADRHFIGIGKREGRMLKPHKVIDAD